MPTPPLFFITESAAAAFHVIAVYFFISIWGFKGSGIAFMALYVFYTLLMLVVIRHLIGATWNRHTFKMVLLSLTVMAILMFNCSLNLNPILSWGSNLAVLGFVSYFCLRQLSQKSGIGLNSLLSKFKV